MASFFEIIVRRFVFLAFCGLFLTESVTGPVQASGGERSNAVDERGDRQFSIRGMGFWGNQRLRHTVQIIADDEMQGPFFSAGFLEDSALVLLDSMTGHGYLYPSVVVKAKTVAGESITFKWAQAFTMQLPRSMMLRKVRFTLVPGKRFFYEQFGVAGLVDNQGTKLLTPEEAESFFFASGFWIRANRNRVFTPDRFRSSLRNLRETLQRQGYRDAVVTGQVVALNRQSGGIRVAVNVEPGWRSRVRRLTTLLQGSDGAESRVASVETVLVPWSRIWEQDEGIRLRNDYLKQGYADVKSTFTVVDADAVNGERLVDVEVLLRTGPALTVGDIIIEGRHHTRLAAMRRRITIKPGMPLDSLAVEYSRQRLAGMGGFDSVLVGYRAVAADAEVRDVVFSVEEARRLEISLLAGYGSYELLRGGFEIEQKNLGGLGHRSRFMLIQSFKSTEADYVYTIPELLNERVSGFSRISALRRTELDFLRQEVGASAGVRRFFPDWNVDLSLRYTYEFLRSLKFDGAEDVGIPEARVGSVSVDVRRDRRDNPVYPRQGSDLFSRLELASQVLGGNAEYVMWEFGGGLHCGIGGGRTWHGGLNHGVVTALGSEIDKLPFNKRFFPGGDRSQRGYRYGQAASVNEDGQLIGSEFYILLQNEVEQALTPVLSLVVFCDMLRIRDTLRAYPSGDLLVSVGGGLRYQTIVGPLRLEYGQNVRRRDADPPGTVHLSIGFPF